MSATTRKRFLQSKPDSFFTMHGCLSSANFRSATCSHWQQRTSDLFESCIYNHTLCFPQIQIKKELGKHHQTQGKVTLYVSEIKKITILVQYTESNRFGFNQIYMKVLIFMTTNKSQSELYTMFFLHYKYFVLCYNIDQR